MQRRKCNANELHGLRDVPEPPEICLEKFKAKGWIVLGVFETDQYLPS